MNRAPVSAPSLMMHHTEQRVAHQGVDLIDQQHQRFPIGLGPTARHLAQSAVRAEFRKDFGPDFAHQIVAQG